MKAAVLVFPGSNCDRDLAVAFARRGSRWTWSGTRTPTCPQGVDVVGIPGGFSYGDYLRCGAIAAGSPIMGAVRAHADKGGYVLGSATGFRCCAKPASAGRLMRNAGLKFVCRAQDLRRGDDRQRLYRRLPGRRDDHGADRPS
jgi:phosphoribosylformylglycinamidine (FGAM) synthase-like amidotransferase family enzyme